MRNDVVVNLRVAVAHVGEPALYGGHVGQMTLHEPQCAVCCRKAGAVGRLDCNQELWCVGFGKQAAANDRHECGGHEKRAGDAAEHRRLRSSQAVMQGRPVISVDRAHHSLQQRTTVRILVAAKQAAREKRNDEHRDDERADDRRHNGHGQHPNELAGVTRKRHERHEGKDQCRGTSHDGDEDLSRSSQRSLNARSTLAQMPSNVLSNDDRIVDQQPQGYDEGCDRYLVQGIIEEIQRCQSKRERQRNGDHDDAGGAPSERQQREHHQADGDQQVPVEVVEPIGDVARLLEADFQLDPLRQTLLVAMQGRLDAGSDVQNVVTLLLVRGHEYCALTVITAGVRPRLRAPAHLRDIANTHCAAASRGDNGVAHLVQGAVAARGPQCETT